MGLFSRLQSVDWVLVVRRRARLVLAAAVGICLLVFFARYDLGEHLPAGFTAMAPRIPGGAKVFVNTDLRRAAQLRRGNVVLYDYQDPASGRHFRLASRVVALPGESIRLHEGYIEVDGERVPDLWVVVHTAEPAPRETTEPIKVPPGAVFLLNDNRADRAPDSRAYGCVNESDILGRILLSS
jgi:signal peptidase I